MNELLRNEYGIYPTWVSDHIFQVQNQYFYITDCYLTEKQVCTILELNQNVMLHMGLGGYIPIKNRNKHFITHHKIVFQMQFFQFNMSHLLMLHQIPFSSSKTLIDLRERWIEKVEFIQKRFVYEINCKENHYAFKITLIEYHIGMAKTAISALNDLIYDYGGIPLNMLCHRRLHRIDFENCMQPLNFILDNKARDLCELYLHGLLEAQEVMSIFERYRYTASEMYYFFCRLLYPSWFFDLVEEAYFSNQTSLLDDAYFSERVTKHLEAIHTIYPLLQGKVQLKPLSW